MSEEAEIDSEKTFEIEINTDKNNLYKVLFILDNSIEITANQINDIIHKTYSSKYSFEEICENEYFSRFNNLNEIFDELKDKRCEIKENKTNIFINIQLPENKELIFELKPFYKNNNERFNEMAELILKIKEEMDNIKKEVI